MATAQGETVPLACEENGTAASSRRLRRRMPPRPRTAGMPAARLESLHHKKHNVAVSEGDTYNCRGILLYTCPVTL